jgi:hypothetical protein
LAAGNQFGLSGVSVFDGAGNVAAAATPGGPPTLIGSYNVNSDCSVSVSISDVFGTNTTATQFAGVILGRGAEIDLKSASSLESQNGSTSGTTTGTTTGTSTSTTGSTTGQTFSALQHSGTYTV